MKESCTSLPVARDEPIMLKKYPIMLCCTAPKSSYYAQQNTPIMLKLCSLNVTLVRSENQPSGLFYNFKYAWVVPIF